MRTTNSPTRTQLALPFSRLRSANAAHSSRNGITLLFVVSMIVLFLLMGTAFVVLASDFMRTSKTRIRVETEKAENSQEFILGMALNELLRGPDLNDVDSPLRFHDILSDQYGYGLKAYVAQIEFYAPSDPNANPGMGQIVRLRLKNNSGASGVVNRARKILDDPNDSPDLADVSLTEFSESYTGNVLSFVNGPEKGYSGRIIYHEFDSSSAVPPDYLGDHWFWLSITKIGDSQTCDVNYLNSLVDSEVIINNREFSGTGPAYNPGAGPGPKLGPIALQPNRRGQSLTAEINTSKYVSDLSTNEPWDSADAFSTLFLSGYSDAATPEVIASFRRTGPVANGGFSAFPGASLDVDADNDGAPDSIWMDLNFPVKSHQGGFYKTLVAYKVVDLDGRLNINAHGELTDSFDDRFIPAPVAMRGTPAVDLPRGQGFGPADISLRPFFFDPPNSAIDFVGYQNLVQARFGSDGLVGTMRNSVNGARVKMFGQPFDVVDWGAGNFGTVGNLFASSPMDVRGRFALGRPTQAAIDTNVTVDNFVDLNFASFPNSMPVIDVGDSNALATAEMHNSLYGLSFEPNQTDDTPFTELDLERVLRPTDLDTNLLSSRLWNIPSTPDTFWVNDKNKRELITTASFEVPTSRFAKILFDKVSMELHGVTFDRLPRVAPPNPDGPRNEVRTYINNNMVTLFAPELFQSLKMNVNRPFGNGYDDDGDGIVDNPEEAAADLERNTDQETHFSATRPAGDFQMDLNNDQFFGGEQNSRTEFARHLFCLAMLVSDEYVTALPAADRQLYVRKIAQWAVNVVDYRDPDSIMTRFHFDPEPFVDQAGTGQLWDPPMSSSGPPPVPDPQFVVWGMERPELLITETFAAHARRIEGPANSPVQGLRPEPFAFIELYNPWTQNSLNQSFDASLYNNQGVDLSRTNGNNDPVWRMQIDRPSRTAAPAAPQTPVRFVYFTDPGAADRDVDPLTQEVFYSTYPSQPVRPGTQAMIGTEGVSPGPNRFRCYMGRLDTKTQADEIPDNLDLDDTNHIELDLSNPTDPVVRRNFPTPSVRSTGTIIPINRYRGQLNPATNPRPFSISDPFGGYTDVSGGAATQVPDGYRYTTPGQIMDRLPVPVGDNNRDARDIIDILQHNQTTNSFRLIYLQRLANPEQPWDANLNPYISVDNFQMDLLAFNGARASNADPQPPPAFVPRDGLADSLERNGAAITNRQLWGSLRGQRPPSIGGVFANHYFNIALRESLGMTNDLFEPNNPANQLAFPWLSWNNRPYASHLELMNVPATGPNEIANAFSMFLAMIQGAPYNPYTDFSDNIATGNFSHLINFFHAGAPDASPNLYSLMEFLEVPSRFADTTQELIPLQPVTGSSPVPGFALNPFNTISRFREPGKINLNSIYHGPVYQGLMGNYVNLGGLNFANFRDSRGIGVPGQENPFRPSHASDLVPPGFGAIAGPESTLFRSTNPANPLTTPPLFDFSPNATVQLSLDADRSSYFKYAQRQRLGNLATDRSSVFAIWITVGFFECNGNGVLTGVQRELGIDEGTVRRHRGFFIFDRSIPVAYEPGKNHNIEKAILVRRFIE